MLARQVHRVLFLRLQAITASRLVLALAFAGVLALPAEEEGLLAGLVLLLLLETTDLADGFLARRWGVVTRWGELFDPLVDSVSRILVYWTLASEGMVFDFVPLVMALRDVLVAYSRLVCAHEGAPVASNLGGKLKALFQGTGAIVVVLLEGFGQLTPELVAGVSWALAAVTAASATGYVRGALRCLPSMTGRLDHG